MYKHLATLISESNLTSQLKNKTSVHSEKYLIILNFDLEE